jgi:hypothetical protein
VTMPAFLRVLCDACLSAASVTFILHICHVV